MSTPQFSDMARMIQERIKAARPSHLLYNPSDEWVEVPVNGMPIQIPPDGPGKGPDGIVRMYDGTVAVRDMFGIDPEAIKRARQQGIKRPDLPADKVILSALDAVQHAIKKRAARGITFITGIPAEDAPIKAEAKAIWTEWRKEQAERSVLAYRTTTAAFYADARNTGQPAPPMPDHVQRAQEFLDDYRLGAYSRKRFGCPINCGYYTDDEARLATHIRASHPLATGVSKPEPPPSPEPMPTPPPPPPPLTPPAPPVEPEPEPEPVGVAAEATPAPAFARRPGRPRKVPTT